LPIKKNIGRVAVDEEKEIETEVETEAEEEKAMPLPVETVVAPAKRITKRKRRRRKKRLRHVILRLPRPCKLGTCKPDICCRRFVSRKLDKYMNSALTVCLS